MKTQQALWSSKPLPSKPEEPVLAGVPMLLVNGKYKIMLGSLDPENLDSELAALTTYLLQKKD